MKKFVKLLFAILVITVISSCNTRQTGGAKIIKESVNVPFKSSQLDVLHNGDIIFIVQRGTDATWKLDDDLPINFMKDTTYTDDEKIISVRKAIVTACFPGWPRAGS